MWPSIPHHHVKFFFFLGGGGRRNPMGSGNFRDNTAVRPYHLATNSPVNFTQEGAFILFPSPFPPWSVTSHNSQWRILRVVFVVLSRLRIARQRRRLLQRQWQHVNVGAHVVQRTRVATYMSTTRASIATPVVGWRRRRSGASTGSRPWSRSRKLGRRRTSVR